MAQLLGLIHGEEIVDGPYRFLLTDDGLLIFDELQPHDGRLIFKPITVAEARQRSIGDADTIERLRAFQERLLNERRQDLALVESGDVGRADNPPVGAADAGTSAPVRGRERSAGDAAGS